MRYLTKSLFKLALECPTKLYYAKKKEYDDQSVEDSFLSYLAQGGYQVNELAKLYYPEGDQIKSLGTAALTDTLAALNKKETTIFEAAINFKNYFVRVDILKKNKNKIKIIEVKSKSIDSNKISFLTKNGIKSDWKEYILDVAFQKFIVSKAFPEYEVSAYLMLVDKMAKCPTEGLNQKFRIKNNELGQRQVYVSDNITKEDLGEKLLITVNVDDACEVVFNSQMIVDEKEIGFADYLKFLSDHYEKDKKIKPIIKKACGNCQFKTKDESGLKSGFKECFIEMLGWKEEDFKDALIFEIFNYKKKDKLIAKNIYKIKDVKIEDIDPEIDFGNGLTQKQRQWIQIKSVKKNTKNIFIDKVSLKREFDSWAYPLHFIDFETSMVAIPFNKGRRPYEGIAFQFSHHVVDENGLVEHKGQYLNISPGVFPNYMFIRELKKELENDEGTIFRYAPHENTYLNIIYNQLKEDTKKIPDKEELMEFIKSITQSVGNSEEKWQGERNMVDMLELVKLYYYNPLMKGSNSIKAVLPAVLNTSKYLKNKYSKPIYGSEDGLKSKNYKNWKWIEYDNRGNVMDPYSLLPKIFEDIPEEEEDKYETIKDGGGAMSAYVRMQFEDLDSDIRDNIAKALLKYCELDTLAMVMIYEAWREELA